MAEVNQITIKPTHFFSSPKLRILTKSCYHYLFSHAFYIFIIPTLLSTAIHLLSARETLINHANHHLRHNRPAVAAVLSIISTTAAAAYLLSLLLRPRKIYLLDFACYNHDPSFLVPRETIYEKMSALLSPENLAFCKKVMEKSAVSENVYVYGCDDFPPQSAFGCAREEAETVVAGAVDDLLAKTGVDPREIGIVIVNISTFSPVPSLSAMIVNRYKMREDVLSYHLGGMGCSAGIIAVDLAKRLLQVRRNTYALIMSVESPTSSYYTGDEKSKLMSNCLFRMGGAAVLLSNRASDRRRAKYQLKHTLRTHLGADNTAYNCVIQQPDKDGILGMSISKDLMSVAATALKSNISALGPLVLPISEQLVFLAVLIARKMAKKKLNISPYVPDFKLAFEHFCIHAGGKAVLDAVEKNLNLTEWHMEPSRMTFYRYSNTSSSSLWYELAYMEAKGRIRRGDRVWQIGFGSGFKCGSAVWRALRTIDPAKEDNPWIDVIGRFPVRYDSA